MSGSPYLNQRFTSKIDSSDIKTIFECGSRDGMDALELYEYYHPEVIYAFECNPESIPVCRENLKDNDRIKLIEKAVYDRAGIIDFYPTDMDKSNDKNIGASSMLWHRDNKNEFFQKKIQVEAIRLDEFMRKEKIDNVDLFCMDVQGVELQVLEGMGDMLPGVKYIITEVNFEHFYEGDWLFDDVRSFLYWKGFDLTDNRTYFLKRKVGLTDCLFKNRNL